MLPQISVDLFRTCPTSIRQYRKMWMRTRMFYTTISWRFVSIDQFTVNINCLNYNVSEFDPSFPPPLSSSSSSSSSSSPPSRPPPTTLPPSSLPCYSRHHYHHHFYHHYRPPLLIIIVVVIYVISSSSNRGSIFIIFEKYFKMLYWMKRNLNSN